jgi:hypothetical protein
MGVFDLQVCVPVDWTDEQLTEFANEQVEAGTTNGWVMMHNGNKYLEGDPERVPCAEKANFIHARLEV